jgi:RNA-directed DNA polymerase
MLYSTLAGTPQGGIISPVLANMTLDGLEAAVRRAVPRRTMVNVIRYADDFVITGNSQELLRDKVLPAVGAFLRERGLTLSDEKTRITPIEQGFDFLGQNLRKYGGKLLIMPAKAAVQAIVAKTKEIIRAHRGEQTALMIGKLNPVIRGWANYHHHVCSSAAFAWVDSCIFGQLWRWARRRHTAKGKRWTRKRYFRTTSTTLWQFFATVKGNVGQRKIVDLLRAGGVSIVRHVKLQGKANPYDRLQDEYFRSRAARGWARLHPLQAGCTI